MLTILAQAKKVLDNNEQFALIVKKGTFEKAEPFVWENGNTIGREEVLGRILEMLPTDTAIVSTTGKISRELYEQSDRIFGHHNQIFMTVGGMGHASMIALGLAKKRPDKKVVCIDGDGAALMHMGAIPFIAQQAPENFCHIIINDQAHESVGAMPTGCQSTDFAKIAKAAGYVKVLKITTPNEVQTVLEGAVAEKGPVLVENLVSLDSRADLGRPKESARENKESFMQILNGSYDR